MKRHLIPCALLLFILCAVTPALSQAGDLHQRIKTFRNSKKFKVEYDRFKDRTRVSMGPFYPGRKAEMEAYFYFTGKQPIETITEAHLVFRVYGKDWQFLNNRVLYGIIDGERTEFGEGYRGSHVEPHLLTESLRFTLPMETFKKLANAKSAELKVASVEFALNGEHFAAFRDLLSLAKDATP